jgi:hypothetical protein
MPRVAELSSPTRRLREALDVLQARWLATRDVWQDANAEAFEADYVSHIAPHVRTAIDAIGRMDQLVVRLQRMCDSE